MSELHAIIERASVAYLVHCNYYWVCIRNCFELHENYFLKKKIAAIKFIIVKENIVFKLICFAQNNAWLYQINANL